MEPPSAERGPSISVVVPVYEGEGTVPELVARLAEVLPGIASDYEVLLVNDGSRDGSWAAILELGRRHRFVRGLDLMRNFGQHNALLAGVRAARHELVVTMDDDLQHPPGEVPRLVAALTDGLDVVYGTPEKLPHSPGRNIASWLTKLVLQQAMGADTARRVSAFRVFRTQVRDGFVNADGPFMSMDVLLTWATTRFAAITVEHHPRQVGRSHYGFRKLVTHALNMATGFSTLPLQLASIIGLLTTGFGVGTFLYILVRFLVEDAAPPGFPFLASIISIFSGTQLLVLGIIGEYLARMHTRIMDRPTYVVRRQTP